MKKKLNHGSSRKRTVRVEETEQQGAGNPPPPVAVDPLDDDERGFGGWLKSPDGLDNMKLFVIANSVVMLTTLVYPHLQTALGLVYDMVYGEDGLY